MIRSPRAAAFTLIEMITVITVIAILASLILAVNGLVQRKAATSRAQAEIKQLEGACENYKTDNGGYPQDPTPNTSVTDLLDPRTSFNPSAYADASQFLYQVLTGDLDSSGRIDQHSVLFHGQTLDEYAMARNYAGDFLWKPTVWGKATGGTIGTAGYVKYLMDPFGNSYGYSTAGLHAEQLYRQQLLNPATAASAQRAAIPVGYNPTFDLWSTGGSTTGTKDVNTTDTAKWVKNW